jgi:hypothetical protein
MHAGRVLDVSVAIWPAHAKVAISGIQLVHLVRHHVKIAGNPEHTAVNVKLNANVIDFEA